MPSPSRHTAAVAAAALFVGVVLRQSSATTAASEPKGDEQPLMGMVDGMRAQMCWSKPDLVEHDKCMRFMVDKCSDRTTGTGTCEEVRDYVRNTCVGDGTHKKAACEWATKMGLDMGNLKNMEKVEEKAPDADRSLMGPSSGARNVMCWGRPDLLTNEKCMDFLIPTCRERSSGYGSCEELEELVVRECMGGGKHKALACRYYERLKGAKEGAVHPTTTAKPATDAKEEKEEKVAAADPERHSMTPHESVRAAMCWGKPDLIVHEKCMDFLIPTCEKRSSGHGTCKELKEYVRKECESGNSPSVACKYAEQMGIEIEVGAKEAARLAEPYAKPLEKDAAPAGLTPSNESTVMGNYTVPLRDLDMDASEGLPDQGYNEHSQDIVEHEDAETMTSDWQKEWQLRDATIGEAKARICRKYPSLQWCKMYMAKRRYDAAPRKVRSIWAKFGFGS